MENCTSAVVGTLGMHHLPSITTQSLLIVTVLKGKYRHSGRVPCPVLGSLYTPCLTPNGALLFREVACDDY